MGRAALRGGTPEEKRELALKVRAAYKALPPRHIRYSTVAGRQFQTLVFQAVDVFGVTTTADILGVTHPAVSAILKRTTVRPEDAIRWPDRSELTELGKAWESVKRSNRRNVAVRAGSQEFNAMRRALEPLVGRYSSDILARAAGIPLTRLRRFLPVEGESGPSTT